MSQTQFRLSDIYTPTPKQIRFHKSTADELLYGGAAGGGKSYGIVMDAFLTGLQFPGAELYLFRKTYAELQDTLIKIARSVIPKGISSYNQTRHEIELANGTMLRFRHCHTEADMFNYRGAEMNGLYIDELTAFTKPVYEFLKTRVRANKKIGLRPFIRNTSNPGGIGHAWVKSRFVDPQPEGGNYIEEVKSELTKETFRRQVEFIPATALDNPHISQEYIYELESKPKALRDALLLGKWDAFEGQVFIEWMDDPKHYGDGYNTHVISPFQIPDHWPHWMSLDWGYSEPFSIGWWAVCEETNTVYRYAEWYGSAGMANTGLQLDPGQVAEGIKQREIQMSKGMTFTRVADPHIWDEDRGESIARLFQRHGVYFKKGDNTREAGKMQVHYRMRMRPDGCPVVDGVQMGMPTIYVFSTCRNFIRTIPSLPYDPRRPEDVDTKAEDHAYDDMRYFLMEFKQSAYEPPRQPGIWKPGPIDPFAERRRDVGRRYVPN